MEEMQKKILEIVNTNIEDVVIKPEQSDEELSQLGIDSIAFIRIVVALEEVFGIEIPDEKLLVMEMGTINKMVNVVLMTLNNSKCGEQYEKYTKK